MSEYEKSIIIHFLWFYPVGILTGWALSILRQVRMENAELERIIKLREQRFAKAKSKLIADFEFIRTIYS